MLTARITSLLRSLLCCGSPGDSNEVRFENFDDDPDPKQQKSPPTRDPHTIALVEKQKRLQEIQFHQRSTAAVKPNFSVEAMDARFETFLLSSGGTAKFNSVEQSLSMEQDPDEDGSN